MARSTISCIEEALALPPEERALNEVVGVNDPETALHTSAAINSSYGLADSYPHHSQDGTTGLKLAQVLLGMGSRFMAWAPALLHFVNFSTWYASIRSVCDMLSLRHCIPACYVSVIKQLVFAECGCLHVLFVFRGKF